MADSQYNRNRITSRDIRFREEELILKATKEIVIKFIEMGKITPASFEEFFCIVRGTVASSISGYGRDREMSGNPDK